MGRLSRRKEPVETIVRKYGLRAPLDWDDECEREMVHKQVDLWNRLVDIEQEHRANIRALTANDPAVAGIQVRLDAINVRIEELAEHRKSLRKTRQRDPILNAEIGALSEERKALSAEVKAARRTAREARKDDVTRAIGERYAAVKLAYQQSGLWWGNYNAVVTAYERGRTRAFEMNGELHHKHYGVDGRLTNQIPGGISVARLFAGTHSQVQVAPLPNPDAVEFRPWERRPERSAGRKARYTTLTVTVYTRDGERRTVTWPMNFDRDIPEDVRIKEVTVTRRRIAHKAVWHVVFTCTRMLPERSSPAGPVVAVDLGWRRLNEGLRVATVLRDERGEPEFCQLPDSILRIDEEVRTLRSKRDEAANLMLKELKALPWGEAPDSLRGRWQELLRTPSIGTRALARFCLAWRHEHASWREDVLRGFNRWRAIDKKQWEAEVQHRQRLAGQRRMAFHAAARRIVAGAGKIVFDKLDLAQSARKPKDGSSPGLPDMARRYRVLACVHELRHWVRIQASRAGIPFIEHEGRSRVCWHCGHPRDKDDDDGGRLIVTCRGCGRSYDQDVNDCRYMLATRKQHVKAACVASA